MSLLCGKCLVLVILVPSVLIAFPDDDDEDLACYEEKWTCNRTSLTNLTKDADSEDVDLDDASATHEDFNQFEPAELFCCFVASPYCPVIRWYKDGNELFSVNGVREIRHDGRLLAIFAIRKSDIGLYTCNATTAYGEHMGHSIVVNVELKCAETVFVQGIPAGGEIQVKVGSDAMLTCSFFCYGKNNLGEIYWRNNGTGALLEYGSKYNRSDTTKGGTTNQPNAVQSLTIHNFTKSQNISCHTTGKFVGSHTFHLVPRTCQGTPYVVPFPGGLDEIPVDRGSNLTLKCQIFCLAQERFDGPKWLTEEGEEIVNNTNRYRLTRKEIGRYIEGVPNYEIRLTLVDIEASDTVSCVLVGGENGNTSHEFHVVLRPDTGSLVGETTFFKAKGQWILTGVLLLGLALLAVTLILYRRRVERRSIFFRTNNKPEIDAKFDAFISFSEMDGGSFVRSTLVPMLEDECSYSLSLHYREFIPGAAIAENIAEFIDDSRRIITVVTRSFLKSCWCRFEVDQGLRRAVERPNTLVIIMLEDIPRVEMPKSLQHFISRNTFLVWNDQQRDKMCEKLKRALGEPMVTKDGGDLYKAVVDDDWQLPSEEDQPEQVVQANVDEIGASTNQACSEQSNGTFFKDIV